MALFLPWYLSGNVANQGAAGAPPLTPTTGMQLWYKGDAGTYTDTAETTPATTTGDNVKAWADQSGNARDIKLSSINSPTLVTGALNGLPAVQFASANATLRLTYAYGRTFDVYMLMEQTAWEGGLVGIVQDISQSKWAFGSRLSGGASPEVDWYDGSSATHLGSSLTLNTWFVVTFSAKGTGQGTWQVNQGAETNVANPMTSGNPAGLDMGVVGSGGTGKFRCVEMLLYTSTLGSTDRANNVSYLGQRGGLF